MRTNKIDTFLLGAKELASYAINSQFDDAFDTGSMFIGNLKGFGNYISDKLVINLSEMRKLPAKEKTQAITSTIQGFGKLCLEHKVECLIKGLALTCFALAFSHLASIPTAFLGVIVLAPPSPIVLMVSLVSAGVFTYLGRDLVHVDNNLNHRNSVEQTPSKKETLYSLVAQKLTDVKKTFTIKEDRASFSAKLENTCILKPLFSLACTAIDKAKQMSAAK